MNLSIISVKLRQLLGLYTIILFKNILCMNCVVFQSTTNGIKWLGKDIVDYLIDPYITNFKAWDISRHFNMGEINSLPFVFDLVIL